MKIKRSSLILIILLFTAVGCILWWREKSIKRLPDSFLQELGPGWNLGNSLDSYVENVTFDNILDYETSWGNPAVTKALFERVRQAGFLTVRIPVTWYPHMDEYYNVDEAWMNRVHKVVNDALESDLKVIINVHHDNWYSPYDEGMQNARIQLVTLWQQIAYRFADYDSRLIFEGMNEPRLVGHNAEWTVGTPEAIEHINELNQLFVGTVRSSGGNNPNRYLLVPTYAASHRKEVIENFRVPEGEKIGVSIHMYTPLDFSHTEGGDSQWHEYNTLDKADIDTAIKNIRSTFIDNEIAVVITEYGAINKNNIEERSSWAKYLTDQAQKNGISCLWWDNGGQKTEQNFSLIDRETLQWFYPSLLYSIIS